MQSMFYILAFNKYVIGKLINDEKKRMNIKLFLKIAF